MVHCLRQQSAKSDWYWESCGRLRVQIVCVVGKQSAMVRESVFHWVEYTHAQEKRVLSDTGAHGMLFETRISEI